MYILWCHIGLFVPPITMVTVVNLPLPPPHSQHTIVNQAYFEKKLLTYVSYERFFTTWMSSVL